MNNLQICSTQFFLAEDRLIRPEELEDLDTEESTVLTHREYAESIGASRDNIKIQKKSTAFGVQLVLLGMESQEACPLCYANEDYGL